MFKRTASYVLIAFMLILTVSPVFVTKSVAWSNGGYSTDPSNPDYGTHDWIAEHALDWLPPEEQQYLVENLAAYLYGTELPDNSQPSDGIGDTANHHIYFSSAGVLTDGAAAVRASTEYANALNSLKTNSKSAARYAGMMSHYIADMAVFGHVMGSKTDWGIESHHSDYEKYVNDHNSQFNGFLEFDGNLSRISAYDAARNLAFDTTFDAQSRGLTASWMDRNYSWENPLFQNRVGESLNLAVNYVADVLHTLYSEAKTGISAPKPVPIYLWAVAVVIVTMTIVAAVVITRNRFRQPFKPIRPAQN